MNIILLSGGSGKRLWPLSNDVRSKQFVKLFKGKDGKYESMIQRVYRQIISVNPNAKITIATSKSQASIIYNQLGDKVSVCVEPCRRDTFPAILLASAYLHDKCEVDEDDSIIVCPVDPYVEKSYYECVEKMGKMVKDNNANLTLMGIEPDHPSEKYGYIIPETLDMVSKVKEFKEKPDKITAEKYIKQNALWNAGVFAFQLNYLLNKAKELIGFSEYQQLYANYEELPKISFDYAVVEKEECIQTIRYNGEWRDVGTWNMMAEVMEDEAKGNVILDEKCVNTKVINEIDLPIICMGCKDMVVAASQDGILISDKERSDYLKPYVEQLTEEPKYIEKSWGTFSVIDIQNKSLTIKLNIKAKRQMSYHNHKLRKEIWNIISGHGVVVLDGEEIKVKEGDVITILPMCKHTIYAETDLQIIEIQVGETLIVEDKEKYSF